MERTPRAVPQINEICKMGGVSFNSRTALNATLNMDGRQKGTECLYILMVLSGVLASY
jgi:hypothetical protein